MSLDKNGLQEFPDDFDFPEPEENEIEDETEIEDDDEEVENDDDEVEVDDEELDEELDENDESDETKAESKKPRQSYSKNVQKRINKEVRRREELRAENQMLAERLNQLEARLNSDKQTSEKQLMQNRIANALSIKEQFLEEGEYAKATQVDNDIMDMKLYLRDIETKEQQQQFQQYPAQTQQPQYQQPQYQQPQYNPQQPPQFAPNVPVVQQKWIMNNKRLYTDPGYKAYVDETYDKLLDEGYDPEDASLYSELDRRIGRVVAQPKRREPAPSPNTGRQARTVGKRGLTKEDLQRISDWNLDPNDPEVRKEYLRNKQS